LFFKDAIVNSVQVPGEEGLFTILAKHVPLLASLNPGVVVVNSSEGTSKYFVSGGFVAVNNESTCDLSSIEAVPVSDLDPALIKQELEYYTGIANSSVESDAKTTATVGVDVLKAMLAAAESN